MCPIDRDLLCQRPRPVGRQTIPLLLFFVSLTTLFLLSMLVVTTQPTLAQDRAEAHIVVQVDDHAHVLRTIEFTQPISGLRALQLTGLEIVTTSTSFGDAVCSIEGVGCLATDCFCNNTKFWNYTYWHDGAWQSYPVGASSSVISQTGAAEGWRWGEFGAAQTPLTQTLAADNALTWLAARQTITTGGYGGVGSTVETMLAIGANNLSAADWRQAADQPSLADFIAVNGSTYTRNSAGGAGKLAAAIAATDACLPLGALTPQGHFSPTLGTYSAQSGPNAWAILGAQAISEPIPMTAVESLPSQALPSGGWEWAPGWGADTNSTALALQALIATGESISSSVVISGVAFLDLAQNSDGGFPYDPVSEEAQSDVNSTAYVIQALLATGEDPTAARWTISDTNPITYLLGMQLSEGAFEWQPGSGANLLATQQAIPALLGRTHPLAQAVPLACPGLYLPVVQR